MALNQAKVEIGHMGEIVLDEVKSVFEYFQTNDSKVAERAMNQEEIINDMLVSINSDIFKMIELK